MIGQSSRDNLLYWSRVWKEGSSLATVSIMLLNMLKNLRRLALTVVTTVAVQE